jgi:carbon-monoxide dehydrogenase small subunit
VNTIAITVNGRPSALACTARTHLADFLRDSHHLTGTHLGCEHGVCGACTVLLDGKPVRSCITFAAACDGGQITTIEGYDGDDAMAQLRAAFTEHHALQCGYCTPGMLATARDIVLRLPDADEARIREELSGNLCRCTGYVGIVAAIRSVLQKRRDAATGVAADRVGAAGPAPRPARSGAFGAFAIDAAALPRPDVAPALHDAGEERGADKQGWSRVEGGFTLPYDAQAVWDFMADLSEVAACLPGATLTSHAADRVEGYVAIKFGPMAARFTGTARLERDDAARRGVLKGAGQDSLSNSRASGNVAYVVRALGEGRTEVAVDLQYALQGALAQFSRSGLVRDFVRRMITDFGRNVARRMDPSLSADQRQALAPQDLSPIALFFAVMWDRVKRLFH